MKFKDYVEKYVLYFVALLLTFYLLPLLIGKTAAAADLTAVTILFILPTLVFAISCIYAYRNSFDFFYILLVVLCFIPSIYALYNETAWIYALVFALVAIIASLTGRLIRKLISGAAKKDSKDTK